MKNLLSKVYRILILFVIPLTFVIATAETCDDGNGSSSTDNRQTLSEAFPTKCDIQLDPVYFRYDLTGYSDRCLRSGYDVYMDMQELSEYNYVIEGSDWLDFNKLLFNGGRFNGVKPEVKFRFYSHEYKGDYPVSYHDFNEQLCNHNTIANVPEIKKSHCVDMNVRTIKTTNNGIYINWEKTYTVSGVGTYMVIDQKGKTIQPFELVKYGIADGRFVAARKINNKIVLIENTVDATLETGEYKISETSTSPRVSKVMDNKVNVAGELSETQRWASPIVVELEKM